MGRAKAMTNTMRRKRQNGFTLIELLIVIAIIGIIASILIPNLLDALQKAKQKRTISEMRNVGTAWMAWMTDQVGAGSAGQTIYDGSALTTVMYSTLVSHLQPFPTMFYTNSVPDVDGWKNAYFYCKNDDLSASNVLLICSRGRNGMFGENPTNITNCCGEQWQVGAFVGTDYDQDLVWGDGFLVRSPVGTIVAAAP